MRPVFILALFLFMATLLLPPPSQAEQIWDEELKRFLTPQEMTREDVFLTVEEAVELMFPESDLIQKELVQMTAEQKATIQERIGWNFPEEVFEIYVGKTKGKIDGYAVLQNTIGKHKHMTYMVGVDSRGRVFNVELLVFREARGSEVGRKRFSYQYHGKDLGDPIRINRDIINISGATMSVRSMSAGVKRGLVIIDEFFLKPRGLGSDNVASGRSAKGFWEVLGF